MLHQPTLSLSLALTLPFLPLAISLPQPAAGGITVSSAPVVWVSVDASGSATTITPAVITTEGHLTTVSTAPDDLRGTATYTLSPGGRASTYTGVAPVAKATGTAAGSLEGVFPACGAEANVGVVEPFCLPKAGSELHPGKTYYITWSPSYFTSQTLLTLQILYSSTSTGFTSPPLPASQGFYPWPIPPDFLSSRGNPASYNVSFLLAWSDDDTPEENDLFSRRGPAVFITPNSAPHEEKKSSGGVNVVGIAVPVVVVGVLALLAGMCFLTYRRTGAVPLAGAFNHRSSSAGYGVGQSRGERVGADAGGWPRDNKSETNVNAGGVELTDRDSWGVAAGGGGGGGRNVFREEVERQERLR
ncbi:hypothetical protein C8A05DRAFT_38254 [Staphylotrichum tortipilum]|uniref:Uncharacterized protein n=1 Tax=Staphylotrichum tortipilum TaxID=2831512 RepID=A0AAN6MCZ0_9PEZI|nr:hypothetical protein C8A05DRAFT_38254 [Staphylotrichum longicolle]